MSTEGQLLRVERITSRGAAAWGGDAFRAASTSHVQTKLLSVWTGNTVANIVSRGQAGAEGICRLRCEPPNPARRPHLPRWEGALPGTCYCPEVNTPAATLRTKPQVSTLVCHHASTNDRTGQDRMRVRSARVCGRPCRWGAHRSGPTALGAMITAAGLAQLAQPQLRKGGRDVRTVTTTAGGSVHRGIWEGWVLLQRHADPLEGSLDPHTYLKFDATSDPPLPRQGTRSSTGAGSWGAPSSARSERWCPDPADTLKVSPATRRPPRPRRRAPVSSPPKRRVPSLWGRGRAQDHLVDELVAGAFDHRADDLAVQQSRLVLAHPGCRRRPQAPLRVVIE